MIPRKAARLEAKIDAACTDIALHAAFVVKGWGLAPAATSLRARAARLDKLARRYDRLEATARDADAFVSLRYGLAASARAEAALARAMADAADRGDTDEARRLLAAHLDDD